MVIPDLEAKCVLFNDPQQLSIFKYVENPHNILRIQPEITLYFNKIVRAQAAKMTLLTVSRHNFHHRFYTRTCTEKALIATL